MKINPNAPAICLWVLLIGKYGNVDRLRAALDTGATYTIIPWDVAEILGYDPAKSRRTIPITTASGRIDAPIITVREIRVLSIKKKNIDVAVHDLPPETNIDALLGLDFLRGFVTTIDLIDGKLNIE